MKNDFFGNFGPLGASEDILFYFSIFSTLTKRNFLGSHAISFTNFDFFFTAPYPTAHLLYIVCLHRFVHWIRYLGHRPADSLPHKRRGLECIPDLWNRVALRHGRLLHHRYSHLCSPHPGKILSGALRSLGECKQCYFSNGM